MDEAKDRKTSTVFVTPFEILQRVNQATRPSSGAPCPCPLQPAAVVQSPNCHGKQTAGWATNPAGNHESGNMARGWEWFQEFPLIGTPHRAGGFDFKTNEAMAGGLRTKTTSPRPGGSTATTEELQGSHLRASRLDLGCIPCAQSDKVNRDSLLKM